MFFNAVSKCLSNYWILVQVGSDQFLYLVNRARLGFTEHEYLFVHETQPRSRYRARGGRHRAPQPSSSTSTELDSGLPSTNTYSCTRPNRAPGIELEEVDIELHNHRARHQSHGTSKRMTTSSSITYRAG